MNNNKSSQNNEYNAEYVKQIFKNSIEEDVTNPISLKEHDCVLLTKKKLQYYTHIYNPENMIAKLKKEFGISDEILSRFDNHTREKCCNVISITLYFIENDLETMLKYLNSINRTVKNVKKKLPDWIVRLYIDRSVTSNIYSIEENIDELKDYIPALQVFNEIINSENVELDSYKCNSTIYDNKNSNTNTVHIKQTRSLRFLVLSDPEVNLAVIREADGFVTNLDCHNIKVFSSSDRLFYLPSYQLNSFSHKRFMFNDKLNIYETYLYGSYNNKWLTIYKQKIRQDFFSKHQNLYDLLAGMFLSKLKINRDFYNDTIIELYKKIQELKYDSLITGFDEILLLDIYKDIISINIENSIATNPEKKNVIITEVDLSLLKHKETLFFATDILNLTFDYTIQKKDILKEIASELSKEGIIPTIDISNSSSNEVKLLETYELMLPSIYNIFELLIIIDAVILKKIISDNIFNIIILSKSRKPDIDHLHALLNTPYINFKDETQINPYDNLYDIDMQSGGKIKQKKYLNKKHKKTIRKNKLSNKKKTRKNK